MNDMSCGEARDLMPDLVNGRLGPEPTARLEAHVAGCAECGTELRLVRMIYASRPEVPEGLAASVGAAVLADHRSRRRVPAERAAAAGVGRRRVERGRPDRPWWGVAAAAIAAVALGIGIRSGPAREAPSVVPSYGYEVGEGGLWLTDDGLLAGAPSLEGLTDEALMRLLEELSVESGGAA